MRIKVLICFVALYVAQYVFAAAVVNDFIYDEEQCYIEALDRRIKHVSSPGVKLQQDEDFKLMYFEFKVYGAWFGSGSIRRTVEYYLLLKRLGMGDTEEAKLIETQMKVWGRKVGFSVLTDYASYPVPDREAAVRLFEMIEGAGKWNLWRKDGGYLKAAKDWVQNSAVPAGRVPAKRELAEVQKILRSGDGEICISLCNDKVMRGNLGLSVAGGKMSRGIPGNFFLEVPDYKSSDLVWGDGLMLLYSASSGDLFAWRSGEHSGVVQIMLVDIINEQHVVFVLKKQGLHGRPVLGPSVAKCCLEDVRTLACFAEAHVGRFFWSMPASPSRDLWRWGERVNEGYFWKQLIENGGDISGMETLLILHAKKLPLAHDVSELRKYDELVSRYK